MYTEIFDILKVNFGSWYLTVYLFYSLSLPEILILGFTTSCFFLNTLPNMPFNE